MKAKSRRRLLISSVAMLLVAMLALGTATFAWFTTDTKTSASGVQVKTDKISSLKLSAITGDWQYTLDYNFKKSLKPVSTADGKNWFYAEAADSESYVAKTGTVTKITDPASDAAKDYIFYNMLNVKNTGSANITNDIKIVLADSSTDAPLSALSETAVVSGKYYMRAALVESDCTTMAGRSTAKVAANLTSTDIKAVAADTADAFTGTALTNTATTAATAGTLTATISGGLAAGAEKYYMLLIWFEGQDADCYDATAGNELPELYFHVYEDK